VCQLAIRELIDLIDAGAAIDEGKKLRRTEEKDQKAAAIVTMMMVLAKWRLTRSGGAKKLTDPFRYNSSPARQLSRQRPQPGHPDSIHIQGIRKVMIL